MTIKEKLDQIHQQHLLEYWNQLLPTARQQLSRQIEALDLALFLHQRSLVLNPESETSVPFEPFDQFQLAGDSHLRSLGKHLIAEGKTGCLLLAGGQGTRLQFNGPKGCYPISIIKQKSLFQLAAEKVVAASQQADRLLPLAIMTSPDNNSITQTFFQEHGLFGLQSSQLFFFTQEALPLLNANGDLFLENSSKIAEGPNGNGFCLLHFVESGIWGKWKKEGIEYLNVIFIDNPLADPFDSELFGFHDQTQADVSLRSTEKKDPHEKVGVLVKQGDRVRICEYSELPEAEKVTRLPSGCLKYSCANLGLFCFSMDFIERFAKLYKSHMPLHRAWKAAYYLDKHGSTQLSKHPMAWKFETFLFDLLPFSKNTQALLSPREECFAPLKNLEGPDSPSTVQTALQERDRRVIEKITGLPAPSHFFELTAEFYYPTISLLEKWKGQSIANVSYVDPDLSYPLK